MGLVIVSEMKIISANPNNPRYCQIETVISVSSCLNNRLIIKTIKNSKIIVSIVMMNVFDKLMVLFSLVGRLAHFPWELFLELILLALVVQCLSFSIHENHNK